MRSRELTALGFKKDGPGGVGLSLAEEGMIIESFRGIPRWRKSKISYGEQVLKSVGCGRKTLVKRESWYERGKTGSGVAAGELSQ